MGHSSKPWSQDVRDNVLRVRAENGDPKTIFYFTGVPVKTQNEWVRLAKEGITKVKKPDRTGHNNPNAKITKGYIEQFIKLVEEKNDWYDQEYADEMHRLDFPLLSSNRIGSLRKELHITRKKKSIWYPERFEEENVKLAKEFCINHRRLNPMVSLLNCSSTDECGFKNDLQRTHGKSQLKLT